MFYRSRAPLRIGLAGGGTDVSPFSDTHGGAIMNATISLYAHATIVPREDGKIVIHAIDREERYEFDNLNQLPINGDLDLQRGVYNRIVQQFTKKTLSFELITYIDAPSGSGLGTSSTLVVAIIGAFVEWLKLPLGEYDIARLAYEIEREDLKKLGGKQDQYAATFGGMNFMEFHGDKVIVNPLRIKEKYIFDLEYHLLLYYTQMSRESSDIIEQQQKQIIEDDSEALQSTHNLKKQAFLMKEVLLRGELSKVGEILEYGWQNKKKLAKGVSTPLIDRIYEGAMTAGASGGKISGAGGGGFMIFYCPGNTKHAVINCLNDFGGTLQRYNFVEKGLTTWTSR